MDTRAARATMYAGTVLAMLFFGMSFVSTKIALTSLGPLGVIVIRLVISSSILYLVERLVLKTEPVRFRDTAVFLPVALFQPFMYFLCENFGLTLVSASLASIIIGTIPVVTPVFARVFLGERLSIMSVAGLLLSCCGVLLIVVSPGMAADYTVTGLVLMAGAVLAAAAYAIAVKNVPGRYESITIIRMQNTIGVILFVPVMLFVEGPSLPHLVIPREVVLHLLFLAVFPSSLAFVFLNTAIRALGASKAHVFVNLVPVFSAFMAYFVLAESLTAVKLTGMGVVIGGVFMSQMGEKIPTFRRHPASDR